MKIKLQIIENYDGSKPKNYGKICYKEIGYDVIENDVMCFRWNVRKRVIKILA